MIDAHSRNLKVFRLDQISPIPIRWRSLRKWLDGHLFGMPLWNAEDLAKRYAFSQFSYSDINPGHVVR